MKPAIIILLVVVMACVGCQTLPAPAGTPPATSDEQIPEATTETALLGVLVIVVSILVGVELGR